MKTYTFRQLGTENKIDVNAGNAKEAKGQAAKELRCRESSCLNIRKDGTVNVYVVENEQSNQRLIIKADDEQSALNELALATNSETDFWTILETYSVEETKIADIQYQTISI